mmetsp:Transcript_57431/g.171318  ORF Transcript_57431/g.171318 Transcript_57431/m.171318 type:complete len:489 (-) Transcript_57431:193-1659(-)
MLTEIPRPYLPSRELDAIDAGLLSRSHSDHHAVLSKTDRVGLGVFDAYGGDNHVAYDSVRESILVGGDHLLDVLLGHNGIVPLLRKGHAVHLPVLQLSRIVIALGGQHNKLPPLFRFQNLQRLRSISGCHDTVRHFLLQNESGRLVHLVGHRGEITERTHGIGVTGPQVRQCDGSQLGGLFLRDFVRGALIVGEWYRHCRTRGTDVLKTGGGGQSGRFAQFFDELPRVGSVQEVNVSGNAVEDIEREVGAETGEDLGGLLVGVAPVLEGEFGLVRAGDYRAIFAELLSEPRGNGRVVAGREGECLRGEATTEGEGGATLLLHHLLHLVVLIGTGDDGGKGVILGGGSKHGGSANINVLDALGEISSSGHGLLEGVQVENGHVDLANAQFLHIGFVGGVAPHSQESTVYLGVEGLDTSIEAFVGARVFGHVNYGESGLAEFLGSASRGEELDVLGGEVLAQFDNASFVRDADKGAGYGDHIGLSACYGG